VMVASEEEVPGAVKIKIKYWKHLRRNYSWIVTLWSLWTTWWSNVDILDVAEAPYDIYTLENELGLFYIDGSPKPIVQEMKDFAGFYSKFPYQDLPLAETDAVCILTKGQDQWPERKSGFYQV
jgi:hypothetical protein